MSIILAGAGRGDAYPAAGRRGAPRHADPCIGSHRGMGWEMNGDAEWWDAIPLYVS